MARHDYPARAAAIAGVVILVAACKQTGVGEKPPPAPVPTAREQQWADDIDSLVDQLAKRHVRPFAHVEEAELRSAADRLKRSVGSLDDVEVVVRLAQLTALIGDGHTGPTYGALLERFRRLPLKVMKFPDGFRVTATADAYLGLLGARLTSIGEVPIDEVAVRLATTFASENEWDELRRVEYWLPHAELLASLGVVPDAEQVPVSATDADGKERRVVLHPVKRGESVSLTSWLDRVESVSPSLERRSALYSHDVLEGGRTVYVRYDACVERGQRFDEFASQVFTAVDASGVERVVVDLRRNTGGDSRLVAPLLEGLRDREKVNRPGGLYVLIGRNTFSSGYLAALRFREETNAALFGEPTGQAPNAAGEVIILSLPHSKLQFTCSTKYFRTSDGNVNALVPDVSVALAWDDYRRGHDSVLDAVLARPAGKPDRAK